VGEKKIVEIKQSKTHWFLIFDDGQAYIQRKGISLATEEPLKHWEELIIALCERESNTPSPLAGYRERVVKYLNGTKAVYSGNSHATANLARWLIDDVIKAIESGELEKGL
jgi:hypothetical protein